MSGIYLLIALTIIFGASCILLRSKNKSFEGMICKFMASFGFISISVLGNYLNSSNVRYFSLICIALMFGFCGDIFLGIKEIAPTFKKKLIPIGTGYFLIGHIFQILAFMYLYGMNWYAAIFFPVGMLLALGIIKGLKMALKGSFAALLCVYYGLLVWKIAFAATLVMKEAIPANIMALVGACLFLISDTCLGILYFTPVKRKNLFVTAELSTYYPAQILLAMSVAFR